MKVFRSDDFTRYSINSILTKFLLIALGGVISIITVRALGPEDAGRLSLLFLIPALSVTLGRMGIGEAINHYANSTTPTRLIINSFFLSLLMGALLPLLAASMLYLLNGLFLKEVEERYITLIIFFIPLFLFSDYLISLLQGLYRINYRNTVLVVQYALNLILLTVIAVVFKLSLFSALAASITALFIGALLSAIYLFREVEPNDARLDAGLMKRLLHFGLRSHVGNVLKYLSYRGDLLIVGYFLTPASVGHYVAAVTLAEIVWKIPDAIGTVLLPRVAMMSKEDARLFTPRVCRRILLTMAFVCLAVLLLSERIVLLTFGAEYLPSSPALVLLAPGILAFAVWKILANDIIAQGHPFQYSYASAATLLTMIAMDLYLIPRYGVNGAAIASTVSYTAGTVAMIVLYVRITKNTVKSLLVPVRSDYLFLKDLIFNMTVFKSARVNG